MKITILILFFLPALLNGEWIEPFTRTAEGLPVPYSDYKPVFPRDHGSHRGYGIEWWYWVGHLTEKGGEEKFGFQSTVFRLAGDPQEARKPAFGNFGNRQLYMAHTALSDLNGEKYLHRDRILREGWQASASDRTLSLKVGGIEAVMLDGGTGHRLKCGFLGDDLLELELVPKKPLVRFGDNGLSRKGNGRLSVSWYWSYTRLQAKGKLRYEGKEVEVSGLAWMDHEISSSQLGDDLEGWDWTCIQLADDTEVKAYRLRRKDGRSDPWSAVYWIDEHGKTERVYGNNFSWIVERTWTSPSTGLKYPTTVRIEAIRPGRGKVVYRLSPIIENQEFIGKIKSNAYWEGACRVSDDQGRTVGKAYLELAGYAGDLGARLN